MQKHIIKTLSHGIPQKTAGFAHFTLLMEDLLQRIHFQRKNQVMMQQKEHYSYHHLKRKEKSTNFQNGESYCNKSKKKKKKREKIMRRKPKNRHIVQLNHTPNLLLKQILQLMIFILPSQRKAGKKVIQTYITLILSAQNLSNQQHQIYQISPLHHFKIFQNMRRKYVNLKKS